MSLKNVVRSMHVYFSTPCPSGFMSSKISLHFPSLAAVAEPPILPPLRLPVRAPSLPAVRVT